MTQGLHNNENMIKTEYQLDGTKYPHECKYAVTINSFWPPFPGKIFSPTFSKIPDSRQNPKHLQFSRQVVSVNFPGHQLWNSHW